MVLALPVWGMAVTGKPISMKPSRQVPQKRLAVLNWNVWMGTNGKGYIKMGDFETRQQRESRYLSQMEQLSLFDVDVIFLQELSPVFERAKQIAEALDMDVVSRGDNCGIRIGSWGVPFNLQMGMAILAKPGLRLKKIHLEQPSLTEGSLPGHSWGFCKPWGSFQLVERRAYLAASIRWHKHDITLINTHFMAEPGYDAFSISQLRKWKQSKKLSTTEVESLIQEMNEADVVRLNAARFILSLVVGRTEPIIMAGDFNTEPSSAPIQLILSEGFEDRTHTVPATWMPSRNNLVSHQVQTNEQLLAPISSKERFKDSLDFKDRKIDYIFFRNFPNPGFSKTRLVFSKPVANQWLSDHFGLLHVAWSRKPAKTKAKNTNLP